MCCQQLPVEVLLYQALTTTRHLEPAMARILIVDEDRVAAAIAQAITLAAAVHVQTPFGVKPTTAASAAEVREFLRQFNYELLVVDATIAKDNDWELVREVRSKHDKFSLPIIVTAQFESVRMAFSAVTAGANLWVTKPFQPEQLASIISVMCSGR